MQKNQKIILIILVVFLFAASVYFLSGGIGRSSETTTDVATSTPIVNPLSIETKTLATTSGSLELTIDYPQITNAEAESAADEVNTYLKKTADSQFAYMLGELKKAQADPLTDGAGWDVLFQKKLIKDMTYTNTETGILSVAYNSYQDTGGAHGTPFYESQVIDTKSGIGLALSDFLKGNYKEAIIEEIDEQIRSAAVTCVRCDRLAQELDAMKVSVPESFVLSDQGITFLFGAYDLGSYAATASGQEVFVDKEFLAPYIAREW